MEELKDLLKSLSEADGVSSKENEPKVIVKESLQKMGIQFHEDRVGNIIAEKKGKTGKGKVMIAAHIDEIGLLITAHDENVLRFTTVGGFDDRILLGQEVIVHGKKNFHGIIGNIPPHFLPKEKKKEVNIEDLFIDVGLSEKELKKNIEIGTFVSLKKEFHELFCDRCCGKALDNRTNVTVLLLTLKELLKIHHDWDVYAVFTVQEEVTGLGALSSAYNIHPTVGIAIDVGFGKQPGLNSEFQIELNKGPSIAIGPNIHPGLQNRIVEVAKEYEIPYQIEAEPGATGTDASTIQISREGIPTILVSTPLLNMHTPCEIVSLKDIKRTARLLSLFVSNLTKDVLKGEHYAS
jgi:putative aminopeptidase FrvX